ncbi:MAG: ABC transporter ATP-binding protein [Planctomyces sp.]
MIEVQELTRIFGDGPDAVTAVDHLSFCVSPGEVYGLLGANGAGKTTTLRMILGLLKPTSGDVDILGQRVSQHPDGVKRQIGLVSASAGLYQWLTPREILEFFAGAFGLSDAEADAQVRKLVDLMDLHRFLDRRCANLSTGQKQRVNLARALVHDPPVVLLDEPTRGLDVVGSQVVFDFVATLRQSKKSIVVCTHQLDEAERLCDRFGLLHRGRLRHEGTLSQLRTATGKQTIVEMFVDMLKSSPRETVNAAGTSEHHPAIEVTR